MKKIITLLSALLAFSFAHSATGISDVVVDLLKGYEKYIEENGDTTYRYMGRVTYKFFSDPKDSVFLDFGIIRKDTDDWLNVFQKTGDIGRVKQKNPGDTIKTAYFRTELTSDISGEFIGVIVAEAEKSRMWAMADSLVGLMSLDQRQMTLYNSTTDPVYENFGQDNMQLPDGTLIVGWRCADGPHGIRYPLGEVNEYAIYGAGDTVTLFPTEAAIGCSFDTDLANRLGQAIGKEGRAKGIYCNLGPMSDLVINPRWGRAFETMSEDPYLCGKMASSQVRGLQSVGVLACPKHFTPYVTETERFDVRIILEERALRELFCQPFRMCIEEANARAIMTCYHRVRVPGYTIDDQDLINKKCDKAGSNRHTIHDILRHDWGFDGIIMTDWQGSWGVDDIYSIETEYDMSMPEGNGGFNIASSYISGGYTSEEYINRKASRIMYGKLWAWGGQLLTSDDQIESGYEDVILSKEHIDLSVEAARKCIVLAKNDPVDGTPVLPIDKTAALTIAVVGPYAKMPRPGGGGSSAVTPDKITTILEGFNSIAAANSTVTITDNIDGADIAIVCVGIDMEQEDRDRPSMLLPATVTDQEALVENVMVKVPKTVVVYTGGSASSAGKWSEAPAIVVAFYPGRPQGQAVAEAIFGEFNPGGHLSVTFPASPTDLPSYEQVSLELHLTSVDTAHGYFFYEKTGKTPLFWFGHGLSYTTFSYDNIRLAGVASMTAGDRIDVIVSLTNTGTRTGDDVVQLYVKPPDGSIPRRVKDLRGFSRVTLEPGETKDVPFILGPRDFSVYVPDVASQTGKWEVIPGEYEIIAGSTSDPAMLTGDGGTSVKTTITIN